MAKKKREHITLDRMAVIRKKVNKKDFIQKEKRNVPDKSKYVSQNDNTLNNG